jgi:hypothetical protein
VKNSGSWLGFELGAKNGDFSSFLGKFPKHKPNTQPIIKKTLNKISTNELKQITKFPDHSFRPCKKATSKTKRQRDLLLFARDVS